MTTPQLPPLPEPCPAYDFTEDSLVYSVGEAKKIQREAFDAGAALSARPVAESIHAENAKTLQALVDGLREMLGVKDGESLKEAVQARSASAVQSGWQPIETAPKDELIVIYQPKFKRVTTAINDGFDWVHATNWQPLPPAPTKKEQEA